VIVDLSRVTSLTSAGVQALLRERTFGRPALFCRENSSVERVLDIVQAYRLVPICNDLTAAITANRVR
jgi:anti-anti-sigma regulatory factor